MHTKLIPSPQGGVGQKKEMKEYGLLFNIYKLARTLNFPQYRKYKNNKNYFKIISENAFEEIRAIGDKYFIYQFTVKILPDRNFIADMLNNNGDFWETISEEEYLTVRSTRV